MDQAGPEIRNGQDRQYLKKAKSGFMIFCLSIFAYRVNYVLYLFIVVFNVMKHVISCYYLCTLQLIGSSLTSHHFFSTIEVNKAEKFTFYVTNKADFPENCKLYNFF